MKLIYALFGAISKREHKAQLQHAIQTIDALNAELADYKARLEPPMGMTKKGTPRKRAVARSRYQPAPIFNRIIDIFYKEPGETGAIRISDMERFAKTPDGTIVGQLLDDGDILVTNQYIMNTINHLKGTDFATLPHGLVDTALRNKIIVPSNLKKYPGRHRLKLPSGTVLSAVRIDRAFIDKRIEAAG